MGSVVLLYYCLMCVVSWAWWCQVSRIEVTTFSIIVTIVLRLLSAFFFYDNWKFWRQLGLWEITLLVLPLNNLLKETEKHLFLIWLWTEQEVSQQWILVCYVPIGGIPHLLMCITNVMEIMWSCRIYNISSVTCSDIQFGTTKGYHLTINSNILYAVCCVV